MARVYETKISNRFDKLFQWLIIDYKTVSLSFSSSMESDVEVECDSLEAKDG